MSPRPPTRSPQYARYSELRGNGDTDEAATVLKEIEDYNLYDCRSTRGLRDWLIWCGPTNAASHRLARNPFPMAAPSRTHDADRPRSWPNSVATPTTG